jgi:hypothetical protein
MKFSKTMTNHPGVSEVLSGDDEGSDYKYWVGLKPGWTFENGRMAGCSGAFFNKVSDFLYAKPVPPAKTST